MAQSTKLTMAAQKVQFYIDIVGACSLKCPSCPKGNMQDVQNSAGIMSLELLDQILVKAKADYDVESINLYNWTEPFVHPKLPEIIRLVHEHGLACGISSNLNHVPRLEEVMAEKPDGFRVSLSGFNQSVYERTHTGGNIEKVKENIKRLAQLWRDIGASTYVEVHFHRYLGNMDDEIQMRDFVTNLGLNFTSVFASFCPLEKVLHCTDPAAGTALTEEDKKLIDILYLTPQDYYTLGKNVSESNTCARYTNQVVLNHAGEAQLCCIVYDESKYGVGDFLKQSKAELLKTRMSHDICKTCCKQKLNERSFTPNEMEEFTSATDRLIKARIKDYYSKNSELKAYLFEDGASAAAPPQKPAVSDGRLMALQSALAAKDDQIKELKKLLEQQNCKS